MASITFGQIKKYNAEAGNGFSFDVSACVMHDDKQLNKTIDIENGDKLELILEYYEERTGEGWTAKATGRQLPTLRAQHLIKTHTDGFFRAVTIFTETIGEPKNKKMFNYLLKLSHSIDVEAYTKKALATIAPKEQENTPAPEIDENSPVNVGMEFADASGEKFTITQLDEMIVDFNDGGRSLFDFGTSRTVKAIIDALGNGAKLTKAAPTEEQPKSEQEATEAEKNKPEKPYKTAEEITTAFIMDGWSNTTTFKEATPEEITAENIRTRCRSGEQFFIMNNGNLYDASGALIYYNIPAAEAPKTEETPTATEEAPETTTKAPQAEETTEAQPAEAPNDETTEAAPDIFAELAKAFITGKQAPRKARTPKKEEPQEQPPEEPKSDYNPPEEETTAKAAPGYTGKTSDILSEAEAERLTNGEQVKRNDEETRYNRIFTTVKYTDRTALLYSIDRYQYRDEPCEALQPGADFHYIGFITDGKTYTNADAIREEMREDIAEAIRQAVPDEATARANAESCEEWQRNKIESAEEYGAKNAADLFYNDEPPTLYLYDKSADITAADVIRYIENPAQVVTEYATEYAESHAADIAADYIRYNLLVKGIEEITADPTHPAHLIKKIAHCIGKDEKTARIELNNGETVTAEANAIRYITRGYISEWYIKAVDRKKLNKDERGRAQDIKPEQIKTIRHGNKILYKTA